MRGSDFIFDCVDLLHYKCHKINLKPMDHIQILLIEKKKQKKAAINYINDDDKCFQHTATVALDHEQGKICTEYQKLNLS